MRHIYLIYIFFFSIYTFSIAQTPAIERDALIALYNSTDGPNWNNNTNWNTAAPVNTWFGITTNATGNVIGIDLNSSNNIAGANNLNGTLPDELGNLQSLVNLDLAINDISGPIPASLTTLTNLQVLNLFSNNITGTIPNNIGDLINLRSLRLGQNELTGTIPLSLTTLSNLFELELRFNELTGVIPIEITNMIMLTRLSLDSNEFIGFIYPEYGNLINLTSLSLSANQLTGPIPTELGNLINMRDLRLGGQNLTGTLPISLGNMSNIDLISIRSTLINGPIPTEYGNLDTLRFLFLDNNQLTGIIPPELGNISNLFFLHLGSNQLTGVIPPELGNNSNLNTLLLGPNQLTGNVPVELGNLSNLTSLSLENNQLSGNIPVELLNLSNLGSLVLSSNQFEGNLPDFTTIPALNLLNFSNNNFEFGDFENQHIAYTTNLSYFNNPQAKVDVEEIINGCQNQSITLNTSVSGSQNTYQWYSGIYPAGTQIAGATDLNYTIVNPQPSDSGQYYCIIDSNIVTDLTLVRNQISLNINDAIVANTVSDISTCDSDNDGFSEFIIDLNNIENQVLGTQTGLEISYFDTLGNPINLTSNFTNTQINQQTITVRVTNTTTTCFDETDFNLIVNPTPSVDSLNNTTACNSFTLPILTNGTYFTAANGTGQQLTSGDTITASQTVFIYNEANGCSNQTSFEVTVIDQDAIINLPNEFACDSFTLAPLNSGNYFTEQNGSGTQLNAGDIITTTQDVFIYDNSGICPIQSVFQVIITPTPTLDVIPNQTACGSFTLPNLTNGNYFTETNGSGTMLNSGDSISTSQTLFIFSSVNNCSNENSFSITIENPPLVDTIEDVEVCDSFVLPVLINGNYFTQSNGGGTLLNSGDTITTSQTVFIYNEINNCDNETNFDITINQTVDFDLTEENIQINENILIVDIFNSDLNFEYSIDGINFQTANQFNDLANGIYTLFVRDQNGCLEKTIPFNIELTIFEIPNFFTPNGDGNNDFWQVSDNRNVIRNIRIFNRYGKLIKQLLPNTSGWDGTYNGSILPNSDYWYAIDISRDNTLSTLKGHFTLKR